MLAKRKTPATTPPSAPPAKKLDLSSPASQHTSIVIQQEDGDATGDHDTSDHTEDQNAIVQREFYPPEITNARCEQYNRNEIPRPIEVLSQTIDSTALARNNIRVRDAVVHWFKRDLRTSDNRALHLASEKAKKANVPLICLSIVSPQDYQAHLTSAVRVDFELRTLEVLRQDLADKNIPLHIETIEKRKTVPARIVELCQTWNASHVFCNIEYEVDELRREAALTTLCLSNDIDLTAVHDDVVVAPGLLSSQSGKPFAVYTPWYRAWIAHLDRSPEQLNGFPAPGSNPSSARESYAPLFACRVPATPSNKALAADDKIRFGKIWPAGEHEAQARLAKFLDQRVARYAEARNSPAEAATSSLSVHLASGTLAARTAGVDQRGGVAGLL
ncbi:hypothetical protein MBLNU459_g1346t1 [Dothideomycetes sp. NU459]